MIDIPCIIRVHSEAESVAIQEMLFSRGIIWTTDSIGEVQNTQLGLLYIEHEYDKATITGSDIGYLDRNDGSRYHSWRFYDAEELLCFETLKLI